MPAKKKSLSVAMLLLGAVLFFPLLTFSQNPKTITGTVVSSADQSPLSGVTVSFKGTNIGTSTNAEGKFSITTTGNNNNPTLQFSYVGFKEKELRAGNESVL